VWAGWGRGGGRVVHGEDGMMRWLKSRVMLTVKWVVFGVVGHCFVRTRA
jgi:hypothetical protein